MSYLIYNIRLQGAASGWPFMRIGQMALAPTASTYGSTNGVNPFDVLIISGSVWGAGGTGAISFATNTALIGGMAKLDMAYMTYNKKSGKLDILVDNRLGQTFGSSFTVKSGVTAQLWAVQGGTVTLQFDSTMKNVQGTLNLMGRGSMYGNASYRASLVGNFAGQSYTLPRG
ncbi:MAG TPA: hypothetical protein VGB73_06960 [Pyrinomonadaceae bacterium]|jgi:hypothetical protein